MTKRKKPPRDEGSLLLKDISKRLREQFKAYCARRGLSMTQALLQHMKACVTAESKALNPLSSRESKE